LRKEQHQRQKHTNNWSNDRESREKVKIEKRLEKKRQKALKAGEKRHLNWQDKDVKKRIKQNKKKAEKEQRKKTKIICK
jgi:hypothetical protein